LGLEDCEPEDTACQRRNAEKLAQQGISEREARIKRLKEKLRKWVKPTRKSLKELADLIDRSEESALQGLGLSMEEVEMLMELDEYDVFEYDYIELEDCEEEDDKCKERNKERMGNMALENCSETDLAC